MPHMKLARRSAQLLLVSAVALAGGMSLAAGTGAIRLLGVSGEGNSVLIESTEPAAYVVKRPDPMTLLVELRNVSVANAANLVERRDAIAAVSIEQASAPDGKALALVRVSLARPSEYAVRSTRNLIRLDLTAPLRSAAGPALASAARTLSTPAARAASGGRDAGGDHSRSRPGQRGRGRDDRHPGRQRTADAGRRDRKPRPAPPARARFSERRVEGARADHRASDRS